MKVWKKLSAVTLALVMALALCAPALATATTLNDGTTDSTLKGQAGTFATADTPATQNKTLNLKKEITAYNLDETTIKAPTISYTYTIAPLTVTAGTTVTDKADKHAINASVEVPVYTGVGTPTIASSGVVEWASTENMTAGDNGTPNYKDIAIDFSSVVFPHNGVYRYVITEAMTSGSAYASSGVTETSTTDTTNNDVHKRYVDVYVRPADGYTNGAAATDWDIYGYTCFYKNTSITDDDKGTNAVKTIGFVAGTTDGSTALSADSYYTYNVTVSKTVVNDNFAKVQRAFPFTVIFTNNTVTANVGIMTKVSKVDSSDNAAATASEFIGTGDGDTKVIAGTFNTTLASNSFAGVLKIKHNTAVKYIGIPCGTGAEIYETNDVDGATYTVATSVNGSAATTDNAVIATTTPTAAAAQEATKAAYQSTKTEITTTVNQDDNTAHSVAITNTLLNISPTGVTLRYAPYMAMLGAGIVALPLSLRKKEEEF